MAAVRRSLGRALAPIRASLLDFSAAEVFELLGLQLRLSLLLLGVGHEQLGVQLVHVRQLVALALLEELLAEFVRVALLPSVMEEGANVHLVAARAVALDALVFVGVVEPLNGRVAHAALDTARAVVPANAVLERLAVLGRVLEEVRRAAKVARVVRINACLLYTSPSPRDVEESRMPSSA